jgi:hypothetical protein
MLSPQSIILANQVLRDLDAMFPGDNTLQKFKWCWSSDLWALVPALDDNGNQRFEFTCDCGVDVQVHSVNCNGLTEARVLMEKAWMIEPYGPLASYPHMWVLCRWNPPPSLSAWKSSMGTDVDYPATGRYLPVSNDCSVVVIPPRATPKEHVMIARLTVHKLRENYEKWKLAESTKEIKRELPRMDAKGNMIEEPHKDAKFWSIRDRIKNAMPRFELASTIGYGGKTGLGHKPHRPPPPVRHARESLADPRSPLSRELKHHAEQLAKELAHARNDKRP